MSEVFNEMGTSQTRNREMNMNQPQQQQRQQDDDMIVIERNNPSDPPPPFVEAGLQRLRHLTWVST